MTVVAVPYPAQGHVIPMIKLANKLVEQGIKVTIITSDFNHRRLINSSSYNKGADEHDEIYMVSVPDGLENSDDMSEGNLVEAMLKMMLVKLEGLIQKINEHNKITCVIAEGGTGWALEIAKKMGIKGVAFFPASATNLAVFFSIPKLIEEGIIDKNGTILRKKKIHLSAKMPAMNTTTLAWACVGDTAMQKHFFKLFASSTERLKFAEFIICNSSDELEPEAFSLFPKMMPVGPLLVSKSTLGNQAGGNFWEEDSACLSWLDEQPACSVIYVAFGSFTVFDQTQFHELALGLELTNKSFLWVVRPDTTNHTNEAYPKGFVDRIGCRGRMVSWAPQERVLSHPAVACFLSHCGWNSTMEGISNGVPFLCWPYFIDQFLDESYICDVWKVGLGFEKDKSGIVRKGEITNKVVQLLGDKNYKVRAIGLKQKLDNSVKKGSSYKNLSNIIEWMKSVQVMLHLRYSKVCEA